MEATEPARSPRPNSLDEWLARVRSHFDAFAPERDRWRRRNLGYHRGLERLYQYHVPPGARILELGCGTGELLAALKPAYGVGVDVSPEMIARAQSKFPELHFVAAAAEKLELPGQTFDYLILSDLLCFVFDIRELLVALKPFCQARTRLIINMHSRLWQPLLALAEALGLKHPQPELNWVTVEDVVNLLHLAGFETIQTDSRMLMPKRVPLLSRFLNYWLAPFWPFRLFCLTNWVLARLPQAPAPELSVTVICPCRNEAGNIRNIVERLPRMGARTELIFVEGHSQDKTYEACLQAQADNPQRGISVYQQAGLGKKDAVWLGCERAGGDVLMILDADLSVPPEDLPAFYAVLAGGRGEFISGSRLVYPMEYKAMPFLNLAANKFFGLAFSFIIGQHVKDTLCGTKVLLRCDYQRLAAGRGYFGNLDPFGDFDLLFGASKLGLRIIELPIRYRERVYGQTQISRFQHGWMLLKMCAVGLLRLKMR